MSRAIITDMGLVYTDLYPFSVKGWMKTVVDGPNSRFQDVELRYTVIDRRTDRRVPDTGSYKTALDAWRIALSFS